MKELFKDIPESISNIQEIIDKVEDFDLERDVVLPKFSVPEEFYEKNDIKESIICSKIRYAKQLYFSMIPHLYSKSFRISIGVLNGKLSLN